jgi:hypothetical protein
MKSVAGIFSSREQAERAAGELVERGVARDRISFLVPGMTDAEVQGATPTTETEGEGMGKAVGAVVGGASGAALGSFGGAAASLLIPGIGPVAAIGLAAMALFGVGGALAGAAVGSSVENDVFDGLPRDDLFVYEEALRGGRSVLIALVDGDEEREMAREVLERAGAESVDAAREQWWSGVRGEEERDYLESGGDFTRDETFYRRGFERAHTKDFRERDYDAARSELARCDSDCYEQQAYRKGYERGRMRIVESRRDAPPSA